MNTITTTLTTEAVFSDDGSKRYLLKKVWDTTKPKLTVVLLAPSEAAGIALQVYRSLPERYHRLGIVATNAPGLSGIEQTLYRVDPAIELLSVSLLPLVLSIETARRRKRWWSSIIWRNWLSGSAPAGWRPWSSAASTSPAARRR